MDELRARIAEILYGDGDVVSWAWSVQTADMIIWELKIG